MLTLKVSYMVISTFQHMETTNILNALAIIVFYYLNDLDSKELAEQFSTFGGVKRRFSEKD